MHAGWKAQAWAMRWAAPTVMVLCGPAVAAAAAAAQGEIKEKKDLYYDG